MRRKLWHRPLHQRRVWLHLSLVQKCRYYMHPFVKSIINIWMQPLPIATIIKVINTIVVLPFLLFPVIFLILVLMLDYIVIQYFWERYAGTKFPLWDLQGTITSYYNFEPETLEDAFILKMYIDRIRILTTMMCSSIDYVRFAIYLMLGESNGD